MLPKVMTHLLRPLDVTNNGITNKIEKNEFSNYITSIITNKMLIDSSRDVASIKIYLKLSTLKPLHLYTLIQIFSCFKTSDEKPFIKSGFQATRITNAIANARQGNILSLYPYI